MIDFDPFFYLKTAGEMPDAEIDLAPCALAFAFVNYEGLSIDRYFQHLKRLADDVRGRYTELLANGAESNVQTQLAALKHVLADQYGYTGDVERYDDLQNADLIRVIDRAKGLPISLAILYLHAAKAQGWDVAGLNVPGHFVCRIARDGQNLIFDPFHDCKVLQAQDLRFLVKKALGPQAELSSDHYAPASNRDILMRLQNNIKYRLIDAEEYTEALKVVRMMRLFDPGEFRLLLDEGVLCAKTEQPAAAIKSLEDYIEKAPSARDRHDAALLLKQVKESLN